MTSSKRTLHSLLENASHHRPNNVAVVDPNKAKISYGDLNRVADDICAALNRHGIGAGHRVGIYAAKSIGSLASIFSVLKTGATYVPVDSSAPASRNHYIFSDCAVKVIVADRHMAEGAWAEHNGDSPTIIESLPSLIPFGADLVLLKGPRADTVDDQPVVDDLAYILYTSGSTGNPKGVMLTHSNALSFIDWCSDTFQPNEHDRLSSHAPFHFDLSILDIYVSIKHMATLVLIGAELGKQPTGLASVIAEEKMSIWYSTPSILRLLVEFGKIDTYDCSALHIVLFAGEVFPIKHLRALKSLWPTPRYFNLYGPTETNVCTYYEVPFEIPADQDEPFPIGRPCSGDETKVMHENNQEVPKGQEGELYVSGGSVMAGYWNLPDRNAKAFFKDDSDAVWYKTGDIVREDEDGHYIYIGRRDRMVKRRGYRVELGEIESALYRHSAVTEAAVVALPDQQDDLCIKAFLTWMDDTPPSIIALKKFCADNLPNYMIPDRFSVQSCLPKTSTNKIDYQKLKELD